MKNHRQLIALSFALSFIPACGAEVGGELSDATGEATAEAAAGEQQQALGEPFCASGSSSGCWDFWGNFGAYDLGPGLECGVVPEKKDGVYTWQMVECYLGRGTGKDTTRYRANWNVPNATVPGGDIKSLAVATAFRRDGTIFMLGSDNKIRVSSGRIDGDFYAGFQSTTEYMSAVDTGGNTLCLQQIAWINLPSFFAPSGTLLALSCGGAVYARTSQNGVWKWTPAASAGTPWNKLPAGTWLELTHGTRGAYLLSSARSVLKLGDGVADSTGNVTWDNARWLPLNTVPTGWKVQHVGGQFILVGPSGETCPQSNKCPNDPWRVMVFSGQTYSATTQGAVPAPNDGPMPWNGIVDASGFNGRAGGYGLHHAFSRVYSYIP